VHPNVVQADYQVVLDLPAPPLRMYPPETAVAEEYALPAIQCQSVRMPAA
jgi:hypothetical protein